MVKVHEIFFRDITRDRFYFGMISSKIMTSNKDHKITKGRRFTMFEKLREKNPFHVVVVVYKCTTINVMVSLNEPYPIITSPWP